MDAPMPSMLLWLAVSISFFCYNHAARAEDNLPPILDADDIAYFFQQRDLGSLHSFLQKVFDRSGRNYADKELPPSVVARGGGMTYTTAYKLHHDVEQAEYLASVLRERENNELASFFADRVVPSYRAVFERIPSLAKLKATGGLFSLSSGTLGRDDDDFVAFYNKALHTTDMKTPPTGILNQNLDQAAIQQQWSKNGVLYIDNLLTAEALEKIQQIMHESTVWYQTKLPLRFGGYVGAYIDDGLHDRILLELALELSDALPEIFAGNPLRYLWAYKYDSSYTGINLHADQAAVNVNIWLTPDNANLDPESGGLIVFTSKPPDDWDFTQYNTNTERVHQELLKPSNYSNVTIPYKFNRAVIFDSALFHQTDSFKFKSGYQNRRINLTLLYGKMKKESDAEEKDEGDEREEL